MSLANQLPADIWIYIAQFIAPKDLRDLYGVNRVFLDLAFDERYSEVDFLQANYKTTRFLRHLQDPNIALRVRRLRVNPVWFNLHSRFPRQPSSTIEKGWTFLFRSTVKRRPSHATDDWNTSAQRALIDDLTISVVAGFKNLTSLVIMTRYFPHPKSLPRFLATCWCAFGHKLRRLTINAPLGGFQPLLPRPADLSSLEELTLRFSNDMSCGDAAADTRKLSNQITSFLSALSPQLRKLNIASAALGDHSQLFLSLGRFPVLATLSLDIGFYPPLLSDQTGLTRFLLTNASTLRHVRLQPHESFRSPSILGPAYNHFSKWMVQNARDETFLSNLTSLVISPSADLSFSPPFDIASTYIYRSADTLQNLDLSDRSLSFAELRTIVSCFVHRPTERRLKVLHARVVSISPQLFDLLAEGLPGLDELELKFHVLLWDVSRENPAPPDDQAPTDSHIRSFLRMMSTRFYLEWTLSTLRIWQRSHMTTKTVQDILQALGRSIPSLKVTHRLDHTNKIGAIFN